MKSSSNFQVYNASAGSGKTFTLVKEYLKVVLQSDDKFIFQKILAITFTNKAAAEMKERVLNTLELFSDGNESDLMQLIVSETNLDKETIVKRSTLVLEAILQNYSAFGITTIDSFTHKIIRSFAFDLGLNINFEVELDAKTLLSQAVDVLISKIGIDNEITKILIDYSLDKAKEDKSWDISHDLNEFAHVLLNDVDAVHFKQLADKTLEDFSALKKKLQTSQKSIEDGFSKISEKAFLLMSQNNISISDFAYSGEYPKHFTKLKKIKSLKPDDVKFEGRLNKTIEEGKKLYAAKASETSKGVIEELTENFATIYFESKQYYEENHSNYQLQKLALKSLIPLAVLTKINAELTTIKEEHNIRLISEFNQIIANNIKDEPAPFIYERIGQKYMYYFIDEMQDTSLLQWQNLIPLVENALSQENSNLLIVGDGKQAIYRWRGGEAAQFIGLGSIDDELLFSNPFQTQKEVKELATNFRSYSEVITFNNQFFQFVAGVFQNPVYQQLFVDGNKQKVTNKLGGYVSLDFLEKEEEKAENELKYAKKVHQIILDLDAGFSKSDVCILVRKKKDGVQIANYLSENGIEIVSSETLLLQNSKKVNFIVDLLQLIQHPSDEESWLNVVCFLQGHLRIEESKTYFFKQLTKTGNALFFEELKEYGIHFDLLAFHQLAFYEKIETIIRAFSLVQASDAYIQFFLDVIFDCQEKGFGLQEFLDYWEQKKDGLSIVAPEAKNAVQIMTIHKSKGLEFPVVIFPYDISIYHQIKPKAWLTDLPSSQFDNFNELLVDSYSSIKHTGKPGERIHNIQREELELDNFNLLYVALTRSVEQLYIITDKKVNAKGVVDANFTSGVFINFLIENNYWDENTVHYEFGSREKAKSELNEATESLVQQQYISNPWSEHQINMVANSSQLWDTEQGEAISFGNLIHEIMAKIITKKDVSSVVGQYIRLGLIDKLSELKIKNSILNIVEHPQIETYFKEMNDVYTERELIAVDGQLMIPDRLSVKKKSNKVTIIDYKTGKPLKSHHQQVYKYGLALEALGYSIEKKLLIYIGDKIRVEEI